MINRSITSHLALVVVSLIATVASAQENLGISNDNYTPVEGRRLNPSAIVDSKTWLDIRLGGLDAYARNNYAYISNWQPFNFTTAPTIGYDTARNKIWGHTNASILGPAFSLTIGKHAIGMHTAVRGYGSVRNVHGEIGNILVAQELPQAPDSGTSYRAINSRLKAMAWGEIGFTYGTILRQYGNQQLSGAITVKRLLGFYNSSFILQRGDVFVNETQAVINQTVGKYSYAEQNLKAGRGWGFDLGVTYKITQSDVMGYVPHSTASGCESCDYKWKFGAALLDVGAIKFKQNALRGTFDETTESAPFEQLASTGNVSDANVPQDADNFRATLPTALSLSADYNAGSGFFFAGNLLQKATPQSWFGAERANLLGVSARYERKWFGAALPISLLDYSRPQVGLMLRMGPVIVGSDHIVPFFSRKQVKGADLYASVHIPLYSNPACNSCNGKGKSKGQSAYYQSKSARSKSKRNKGSKGTGLKGKRGDGAACPSW